MMMRCLTDLMKHFIILNRFITTCTLFPSQLDIVNRSQISSSCVIYLKPCTFQKIHYFCTPWMGIIYSWILYIDKLNILVLFSYWFWADLFTLIQFAKSQETLSNVILFVFIFHCIFPLSLTSELNVQNFFF